MGLDIPGDNDYKIKGDKFAHGFEIHRTQTGKLAATVAKVPGDILRDAYKVSVEDGEDVVACILCFALIDGIYHNGDDSGPGFVFDKAAIFFTKPSKTTVG